MIIPTANDPFKIGTDNLVALLSAKNGGEIDDSEAEYCYGFVNISVGIWRDMTEKGAEEIYSIKLLHTKIDTNN